MNGLTTQSLDAIVFELEFPNIPTMEEVEDRLAADSTVSSELIRRGFLDQTGVPKFHIKMAYLIFETPKENGNYKVRVKYQRSDS